MKKAFGSPLTGRPAKPTRWLIHPVRVSKTDLTLTFTEIWHFPSPGTACGLAADVFVLGRTMLSLTLPIISHHPICAIGARFDISAAPSPGVPAVPMLGVLVSLGCWETLRGTGGCDQPHQDSWSFSCFPSDFTAPCGEASPVLGWTAGCLSQKD